MATTMDRMSSLAQALGADFKTLKGLISARDFSTTFSDSSMGVPNGSSTAQTTVAATFVTLQLANKDSDIGNNYNATTYIYTVPATGVYLCNGRVRLLSSDTTGSRMGIGIHTSNVDGAFCHWWQLSNATGAKAYPYTRVAQFTTGDQLRMYVLTDAARAINQATMNIIRLA